MNANRYFEDYAIGEREEFPAYTVTSEDIFEFAALSKDDHPAHTDLSFASERFGGQLAHGALTFSLLVGMTVERNEHGVAYGYDRLRFPSPLLAGDALTASSEVVDLREHKRPEIGLVVKRYTGTRGDGAVAVVCEHLIAVTRRP